MKVLILKLSLIFCFFNTGFTQSVYKKEVENYIHKYKDIAIAEQLRTGIPAAIKLAQGIVETGAGRSELCNNAHNHFGIKCKRNWQGETYTYTDDAKNECFRKYLSDLHSFQDHSDFLRNNPRYSILFDLEVLDYKGWANGLKKCGYATNSSYATKLIKAIEDYHLQKYSVLALKNTKENVLYASAGENVPDNEIFYAKEIQNIQEINTHSSEENGDTQSVGKKPLDINYYEITEKNGMKGFYGKKGDLLLEQAIKNKIRYKRLLELNDLNDEPLKNDMFIYLARKRKIAKNHKTHTLKEGETLIQVSQEYGILLDQLLSFNKLKKGEEAATGSVLYLQEEAPVAPEVYIQKTSGVAQNNTPSKRDNKDEDYIYIQKENTSAIPNEKNEIIASSDLNNNKQLNISEQENTVNIANEIPIEEQIESELKYTKGKESNNKTVISKNEENMTPLERLKAHMDKSVYGQEERTFERTKSIEDIENAENYTTLPARKSSREIEPVKKENNSKPTTTTRTPVSRANKIHVVKKGETLFAIAKKHNVTVDQIKSWNKSINPNRLLVGTKLQIGK